MKRLTKVGLALLVLFVVFLLAFAAELICMVCHRRRPRRGPPVADDPELAAADPHGHGRPTPKQLALYFFCWKKNQSRVEPASSAVVPVHSLAAAGPGHPVPRLKAAPFPLPPPATAEAADAELELARWRGLYASRMLFTIREEEKEGVDSDGGRSPGVRRRVNARFSVLGEQRRDEQEAAAGGAAEPAAELTPFSTPCVSPPFYTPSPSPTRRVEAGADVENPADLTGGSESDEDELPSQDNNKKKKQQPVE